MKQGGFALAVGPAPHFPLADLDPNASLSLRPQLHAASRVSGFEPAPMMRIEAALPCGMLCSQHADRSGTTRAFSFGQNAYLSPSPSSSTDWKINATDCLGRAYLQATS